METLVIGALCLIVSINGIALFAALARIARSLDQIAHAALSINDRQATRAARAAAIRERLTQHNREVRHG